MASLSMIIEQCTRSILPPCPIHGMWDSRKTSWDGPANKKKRIYSIFLTFQYRPSRWHWRRGEPRYTAASIHMWRPRRTSQPRRPSSFLRPQSWRPQTSRAIKICVKSLSRNFRVKNNWDEICLPIHQNGLAYSCSERGLLVPQNGPAKSSFVVL